MCFSKHFQNMKTPHLNFLLCSLFVKYGIGSNLDLNCRLTPICSKNNLNWILATFHSYKSHRIQRGKSFLTGYVIKPKLTCWWTQRTTHNWEADEHMRIRSYKQQVLNNDFTTLASGRLLSLCHLATGSITCVSRPSSFDVYVKHLCL